jgi:predicted GTPase
MGFTEELKAYAESIKAPNILVTGIAGGGKSTLINAVFEKALAETGAAYGGLTPTFARHGAEIGAPVTLYDSPGYEPDKGKEYLEELKGFLDRQQAEGHDSAIHLTWYVVNTPLARLWEFDRKIIERLNKMGIPVIVVMAQCDHARPEQKSAILHFLKEYTADYKLTFDIVQLSASPLSPKEVPFGLEELVSATMERLPEIYRAAFIRNVKIKIAAKRKLVWSYVAPRALLCFGTGYVPIPLTTLLSTYFVQKQVAAQVAFLYGFNDVDWLDEALKRVVLKTTEAKVLAVISFVSDLIPFDPFTSTLAGGTAAGFLLMITLSLAETFEQAAIAQYDGYELKKSFTDLFREKFQDWRDKAKIKGASDVEKLKERYITGQSPRKP